MKSSDKLKVMGMDRKGNNANEESFRSLEFSKTE